MSGDFKYHDFRYHNGKFEQIECIESDDDGDFPGFICSENDVGNDASLYYRIYESKSLREKKWIVLFMTERSNCVILVEAWPDLIDLLAKLSPIVMAAITSSEWMTAIEDLLRPTINQFKQRYGINQ